MLAKIHGHSYQSNNNRVDFLLSLVHSDVWEPSSVIGGEGFKYFILFIDDCTLMTWVYFMKHKNEVFEHFTYFHALVQTQFQKNIKFLRSDSGGEFVNSKMKTFCHDNALVRKTTCPYTLEQNGVSERKNRTFLEKARAMLIESNTPRHF